MHRRRPTLNPYPRHYSAAFASSCIPYPLRRRTALRRPYSVLEEHNGLTLFRVLTVSDVDAVFPPGALRFARFTQEFPDPAPCLLAQACQPLWLVPDDDGYNDSLTFILSLSPHPSAQGWQNRTSLAGDSFAIIQQEIRCPGGSAQSSCPQCTRR